MIVKSEIQTAIILCVVLCFSHYAKGNVIQQNLTQQQSSNNHAIIKNLLKHINFALDDYYQLDDSSNETILPVLLNDEGVKPLKILSVKSLETNIQVYNLHDHIWFKPLSTFSGAAVFSYIVEDALGNIATANVVVSMYNSKAPTIKETADIEIISDAYFSKVNKKVPSSIDNFGDNLMLKSINHPLFFRQGLHTIFWRSCDSKNRCSINPQRYNIIPSEGHSTLVNDSMRIFNAMIGQVGVGATLVQQSKIQTQFQLDQGPIFIVPFFSDSSTKAMLSLSWQVKPDLPLMLLPNGQLQIDTSNASIGRYEITLSVADKKTYLYFNLAPPLNALSEHIDHDGDGIDSQKEGRGDNNLNGLQNYLDVSLDCFTLPLRPAKAFFQLMVEQSSCLFRGPLLGIEQSGFALVDSLEAITIDSIKEAEKPYIHFTVTAMPLAGEVMVSVPLLEPLSQNAQVRFLNGSKIWSVLADDMLSSSLGFYGVCPSLSSSEWQPGIVKGALCLRIKLIDGSNLDLDQTANQKLDFLGWIKTEINKALTLSTIEESVIYGQTLPKKVKPLEGNKKLSIIHAFAEWGQVDIAADNQTINYSLPLNTFLADTLYFVVEDELAEVALIHRPISVDPDIPLAAVLDIDLVQNTLIDRPEIAIKTGRISAVWLVIILLIGMIRRFPMIILLPLFFVKTVHAEHKNWLLGATVAVHNIYDYQAQKKFESRLNHQGIDFNLNQYQKNRVGYEALISIVTQPYYFALGYQLMPMYRLEIEDNELVYPQIKQKIARSLRFHLSGFSLLAGYSVPFFKQFSSAFDLGLYFSPKQRLKAFAENEGAFNFYSEDSFGYQISVKTAYYWHPQLAIAINSKQLYMNRAWSFHVGLSMSYYFSF